jgi:hypothetical protein
LLAMIITIPDQPLETPAHQQLVENASDIKRRRLLTWMSTRSARLVSENDLTSNILATERRL